MFFFQHYQLLSTMSVATFPEIVAFKSYDHHIMQNSFFYLTKFLSMIIFGKEVNIHKYLLL